MVEEKEVNEEEKQKEDLEFVTGLKMFLWYFAHRNTKYNILNLIIYV